MTLFPIALECLRAVPTSSTAAPIAARVGSPATVRLVRRAAARFAKVLGVASLGVASLMMVAAPAQAEEAEGVFSRFMEGRRTLGWGRAFNNDYIGDGQDRWQTGSYFVSILRGHRWTGGLPSDPFEIMEYRFATAITAPSKLTNPPAGDRRYAGRLSFSASTYWEHDGLEGMVGLGLTATGADTGIGALHNDLHDLISAPKVRVRANQIGNKVRPFALVEAGREFEIGGTGLRLFSETRAGDESLIRAGFDWQFGARETGALWLRDEITGQRVVGIAGTSTSGAWFTLGADIAHVWKSAYLPADEIAMTKDRMRVRAGANVRRGNLGIFYGVTWLSKEFDAQPEGQVLGTLRARVTF